MHILKTMCVWLVVSLVATAATAQDTYRIKPGDTLNIEVLEDPSLNRQAIVLPDGRFSFPYAGTVSAGGRTLSQIEKAVTAGIASNFAITPNVFVSVREQAKPKARTGVAAPRTYDVYFLGEVKNPGQAQLKRGTTLLQALAQTGGFTRFAAQKRIQLRRTDPVTRAQTITTINYKAMADGELSQDVVLQDGDVILAPERRLFE